MKFGGGIAKVGLQFLLAADGVPNEWSHLPSEVVDANPLKNMVGPCGLEPR